MTLEEKVSLTRKSNYVQTLRSIQASIVNLRAYGFHLEDWCDDRIISKGREYDSLLDEVVESFEKNVIQRASEQAGKNAAAHPIEEPFSTAEPGLT